MYIITAMLLALIAGLFYSYSCSVCPGLGRLSDAEYLRAMQSINRAILNPWFFASFIGTVIMMPVSTWIMYRAEGAGPSFYLFLAASILYIAGVFGVTIAGNVPLNNLLDRFDMARAAGEEIKNKRIAFETPWNRLHLIRTLANIISLVLFLWGMTALPDT